MYLLSTGVVTWVSVSIPIVLESAKLISRGLSPIIKFAINVNYKKYHIFHLIAFLLLGIIISQCSSVYTIHLFTIISGILSAIKYTSITKLDTSNKEFESYCFIEQESAQVIGGVLGLVISQYIYDYNKTIYILGFLVLVIIGTILLFIISGKLLHKIKKNGKLLLTETIIAIIDTACFILSAIMLSWQGILIAYIITAFIGTLADPI